MAAFLRDDDVTNANNVESSVGDFLEVLSLVRSKKLPKAYKFAQRKKLMATIYALAQAVRHRKLQAFRSAKQASLHHNGAETKLVCRFSVSDKDGVIPHLTRWHWHKDFVTWLTKHANRM